MGDLPLKKSLYFIDFSWNQPECFDLKSDFLLIFIHWIGRFGHYQTEIDGFIVIFLFMHQHDFLFMH